MAIRIAYDFDTWDAATITSSSESSSDLADDNAVSDLVGKKWRTDGTNGEWIKFDLGAAAQITVIGLFNFNFTSSATVTLQANATDSWGSPSYSQALTIATDSDGNVLKRLVFFLSQTYRWWRILIDDYPANTDGYVEIGRVAAGTYYEPTRNIVQGFILPMLDPSSGERVPGQSTHFAAKAKFRKANISFNYMDATQADKLETIFSKVGNSEPCILCLDPDNRPSKDSMYAHIVGGFQKRHVPDAASDEWAVSGWQFEEKTR